MWMFAVKNVNACILWACLCGTYAKCLEVGSLDGEQMLTLSFYSTFYIHCKDSKVLCLSMREDYIF